MVQALLLDLDDTLIDHRSAIEAAAEGILTCLGLSNDGFEQRFVDRWAQLNAVWYEKFYAGGLSFQEMSRSKLRAALAPWDAVVDDRKADSLLTEYLHRYISMCRLFGDVKPLLSSCSKLKTAIVTNGEIEQQLAKINSCGLENLFDLVVVSDAVGCAKPDAEIFLHTADQLNVSIKDCVFVGDNFELDANASARVGMRGIWLNRSGAPAVANTEMVRNLHELVARLELA